MTPQSVTEHQCAWEVLDKRCRNLGTMSANTADGGPWYCRGHFGCTDGAFGQRVLEESLTAAENTDGGDPVERARQRYLASVPERRPGDPLLDPRDLGPSISRFLMQAQQQHPRTGKRLEWAYAVLEAAKRGEMRYSYPIEMAREALGGREPGSDDEQ